jgi:hypothetical protein
MRRLLQLLITQPDLLVEHASAYAELASADAKQASQDSKHKILWSAAFLCCFSVSAVLAGIALMLWVSAAEGSIRSAWVLLATPLVPLAAAFACLKMCNPKAQAPAFAKVREQIAADMRMLREVSVP